jgi:hypothetical protein
MRGAMTTLPTTEDRTYRTLKFITKSLASLIPGFGGTASELFDLIVKDPSAKRRDEFIEDLSRRLDKIVEEGKLDPRALLNDSGVSALLLQAVQISMRTEGLRKFEALRNTTARGLCAASSEDRSPAYVVMGVLDRLTDYHLIALRWEMSPSPTYSIGQVNAGASIHRLHYGQPTTDDPATLKEPHLVLSAGNLRRYVEAQSYRNFRLAKFDLIAMGLLEPVQKQAYAEIRPGVQALRPTGEIAGYQLSELGRFIVTYASEDDDADVKRANINAGP